MSLAAARLRETPDDGPVAPMRVCGRLFQAVAAGLLNGPASWQVVLDDSTLGDSELLKRHAYERLLGPLLTRQEERLKEGGREGVLLWAAVGNFSEWLTALLCTAREEGWIRHDAKRQGWPGAERVVAGGFERWADCWKEGWAAPVRLHGFADAVVCDPLSGRWMCPEFAPAEAEFDGRDAAVYRELLRSSCATAEVAILRFNPDPQEHVPDRSECDAARKWLFETVGAMAGVAAEVSGEPGKYTALGDEVVRAMNSMNVSVTQRGEPVIAPAFVRYELMPQPDGIAEVLNAGEDLGSQLGLPAPLMTIQQDRVCVDLARVADFESIPFSRVRQALPPLDAFNGSSIVPLGFDMQNRLRGFDLVESSLLVAGGEGSGRGEWLRMMLGSLMLTNTPTTLRLVLIDSRRGTFSGLERSPYLLHPGTLTDPSQAFASDQIEILVQEMESRQRQFENAGVEDLLTWRRRWGNRMPRIVCAIDELAEARERRRVLNALVQLGPRAWAAGIHLVVCTETPDASFLTARVRSQFRARVCLKVASAAESRLMLGREGAERLLGQGDLLFRLDWQIWRVQAPEFSEAEQREIFAGALV